MNTHNEIADLLTQMRPVMAPDTLLFWPLAWGWWVLIAAGVLLTSAFTWWRIQHRRNQKRLSYLTEAMIELRLLEQQNLNPRAHYAALHALLRRIALTRFPHSTAMSLEGADWINWLNQSARQNIFDHTTERLDQRFNPHFNPSKQEITAFKNKIQSWIRAQQTHRELGHPSVVSSLKQ